MKIRHLKINEKDNSRRSRWGACACGGASGTFSLCPQGKAFSVRSTSAPAILVTAHFTVGLYCSHSHCGAKISPQSETQRTSTRNIAHYSLLIAHLAPPLRNSKSSSKNSAFLLFFEQLRQHEKGAKALYSSAFYGRKPHFYDFLLNKLTNMKNAEFTLVAPPEKLSEMASECAEFGGKSKQLTFIGEKK